MTQVSPSFNVYDLEHYGSYNPYLSQDQLTAVNLVNQRVNSQLDWVAQLLGWASPNYWSNLTSNISQKRALLTGSFGVYNGFRYPKVIEVRNWENLVVVEKDEAIQVGTRFYLRASVYDLQTLEERGGRYYLGFGELPETFYTTLAEGYQLYYVSKINLPAPFNRPSSLSSGDCSFSCKTSDGAITLYPVYDSQHTLPYRYNAFFPGSKYYFDLPVTLKVNNTLTLEPQYDFSQSLWYLSIPEDLTENQTGLSTILQYQGDVLYSLQVYIKSWEDPSDWIDFEKINFFSGVWGNKGGYLPFHFVFDALSIHGFSDEKSVYLPSVERGINFDDLLNFVYYQKVPISSYPPPASQSGQVWWDQDTSTFSVYLGDALNCGPWVEIDYPNYPEEPVTIDLSLPTVASFESIEEAIEVGSTVEILNFSGLDGTNKVIGLTQTLTGPGSVILFKEDSGYWKPLEFTISNEPIFSANAIALPVKCPIKVSNSDGLTSETLNYRIQNLSFTISGDYDTVLAKGVTGGSWFLSPPSKLKYIGNTRLFSTPVEGEMAWDFTVATPELRSAQIYQYDISGWNWVEVNSISPGPIPPTVVDFGTILVYCNKRLLTDGTTYRTEDFQITYSTDPLTGQFNFSYIPFTFSGLSKFPKVTISDSITSAFTFDISHLVFSGVTPYMSPNPLDAETLLRIWKSKTLYAVQNQDLLTQDSFPNGLVADENTGPQDENWQNFFIRLPPNYEREGENWQKVVAICQDFAYWGSSPVPEKMTCPPEEARPLIYEELVLFQKDPGTHQHIYTEPYLYSNVLLSFGYSDDYGNSDIIPGYDFPYDTYEEAQLIPYDPLHNRTANVTAPVGKGYGDWEGGYYRLSECSELSGFLVNDIASGVLEEAQQPNWDMSMYKLPPTCPPEDGSSYADANHYKIGYAFFTADLSAAGEAMFDIDSQG